MYNSYSVHNVFIIQTYRHELEAQLQDAKDDILIAQQAHRDTVENYDTEIKRVNVSKFVVNSNDVVIIIVDM